MVDSERGEVLLPCPFCGKPAKFEDGGFNAIRVACSDFDCEQRRRVHKRDRNCHEKLAAHWNMRTDLASPSDAEQLSELRNLLVTAVIPYEAILLDNESRRWIAPEVWQAMETAVTGIRAALAPKQEGKEPK